MHWYRHSLSIVPLVRDGVVAFGDPAHAIPPPVVMVQRQFVIRLINDRIRLHDIVLADLADGRLRAPMPEPKPAGTGDDQPHGNPDPLSLGHLNVVSYRTQSPSYKPFG